MGFTNTTGATARVLIIFIIGTFCFFLIKENSGLAAQTPQEEELEKEFYNDYLDNLPDERRPSKDLLESNLIHALKWIVPREDPFLGPSYVKGITPKDIKYKKATLKSIFVRGIFHEMPYLKPCRHMWIVKAGSYIMFVMFRADPERYIVNPNQMSTIVRKQPSSNSNEHKEENKGGSESK